MMHHRTNQIILLSSILLATVWSRSVSQLVSDFSIADTGAAPSLVYDLRGGLYVTWQNLEEAVHLRHLDSSGRSLPDSMSFRNTYASLTPRITLNSKNAFVVWEDRISNFVAYPTTDIIGYTFPRDPVVSGHYLTMNDEYRDALRGVPDAGFLDDSTFIAVWSGDGPQTIANLGIYAQICSVNGVQTGGNFLVTDHVGGGANNRYPRIITQQGQAFFIVCWEDNSSGRNEIYARKFSLNGTPQDSSFLVSDDSAMTNMWYFSVAKDSAGRFVVGWIADKGRRSQIEWRWYDNQGTATSPVQQLTPLDTLFDSGRSIDVSIDERGRSIIVWEQQEQQGSRIYGQRYDADRNALGPSFRVTKGENIRWEFFQSVVVRNDRIYTVWEAMRPDGTSGIRANILDFDNPTAVIENDNGRRNQVSSFTLYANYPNPFNPSTAIRFEIPSRSRVTLTVFNLLGQQVAELANEEMNAGSFERIWNAGVASGLYFYRLEAFSVSDPGKRFVDVKKMILLK